MNQEPYPLTIDLLKGISSAAFENARELIEEADLLEKNGHYSRAYFLAVASIEETGKASIAFEAQGRNIRDSAVAQKIRKSFGDHSSKITTAFIPWINASSNLRDAAQKGIELMVELKMGREPSMYTDVRDNGTKVHKPSTAVRPVAAKDSVRLARDCWNNTKKAIEEKKVPEKSSPNRDALYAMKSHIYSEILNREDFWWFHLIRMEAGKDAFEDSFLIFKKDYFDKGLVFVRDSESTTP